MTTLTVTIPDDVAEELQEAGLLGPDSAESIGAWLRDGLRCGALGSPVRSADGADPGLGERRGDARAGWLEEALQELDNLDEDIEEDNLPQVSEHARSEARRVLLALKDQAVAPMVYPTEDAEVSLYFKPRGVPAAVQVLLESDGAATWSSIVPGHTADSRCDRSSELPLALLMTSLQALSKLSGSD